VRARIVFSREAKKHYEKLDVDLKNRIKKELENIASAPFSRAYSKPLVGHKGIRSARVGDWRIIFEISDLKLDDGEKIQLINVEAIRHRREVYRNLQA
jgi:mRNA-degrading endonuclease RelE of RelBE toxin-antitoxin system